jgi:hypothetical protein
MFHMMGLFRNSAYDSSFDRRDNVSVLRSSNTA